MTVTVSVRLTKKLASRLNGVDVSHVEVGDVLQLSEADARMMITEGWAEPIDQPKSSRPSSLTAVPAN